MTTGLLASDIGGLPHPAPDEHAYGIFVHGRRKAPALSIMSPNSPTQGPKELGVVPLCSPSPLLSKELQCARIRMTAWPLVSDIGGLPQAALTSMPMGNLYAATKMCQHFLICSP